MGPLHWESGMFLALAQGNLWLILSCCYFLSPQSSCRAFPMLLVQRRMGESRGTRNTTEVGCLWSIMHGGILPWGIIPENPEYTPSCRRCLSKPEVPRRAAMLPLSHHSRARSGFPTFGECGVTGQPAVTERGQWLANSAPNKALLPLLWRQGQVSIIWCLD